MVDQKSTLFIGAMGFALAFAGTVAIVVHQNKIIERKNKRIESLEKTLKLMYKVSTATKKSELAEVYDYIVSNTPIPNDLRDLT